MESNESTVDEQTIEKSAVIEQPKIAGTLEAALSSDKLLQIIFSLCVLLFATRHDWVIIIVIILFLYAVSLELAARFQLWEKAVEFIQSTSIRDNVSKFTNVTVPGPLRKFVQILFTSDKIVSFSYEV